MEILGFVGMPGTFEMLILLFPVVVTFWILPAVFFCRICDKAGFPGALGLLILLPLASIILPAFLAFSEWPALRRDDREGPIQPSVPE